MPCKVCDDVGRARVGPHTLSDGREVSFLYCEECEGGEILYKEAYFPGKTKTFWIKDWLEATANKK